MILYTYEMYIVDLMIKNLILKHLVLNIPVLIYWYRNHDADIDGFSIAIVCNKKFSMARMNKI